MGVSKRTFLGLAAAVLLAGCGGDSEPPAQEPNIVQAGAPGEPSKRLTAEEAAAIERVEPTAADAEFMRGMIHHHAQALEMTALVPDRTASDDVALLARRIELSQEAEIELMERWLTEQGEEPPVHHGGGHGGELMPGMLTEAELARLEASDDRAFDRRFLRDMTRHHQGALQMVAELQAAGGGVEASIGAFTRHVEADQGIEIARMRDLLADLG